MRSKKFILPALALLASATVTLSYAPAASVNRRPKPKRPSNAIGAGGAGTYARRARPNRPNAAPTPSAPNADTSVLGGQQDGTGIRTRGNQNGPAARPDDPANAEVNRNADTSFRGGRQDGTGVRRKAPRKRRRP